MGKEIAYTGVLRNLVTEPALHPSDLGVELVVCRVGHTLHALQIDQGEHSENVLPVEVVAGKRADVFQVSTEIPAVQANGGEPVCLPLPGHKVPDGQFLGGPFTDHNNPAHTYARRA